jgi:hypothetical protein
MLFYWTTLTLRRKNGLLENAKRVIENIDCDVVWFWPLERICYWLMEDGIFIVQLRKEIPKFT